MKRLIISIAVSLLAITLVSCILPYELPTGKATEPPAETQPPSPNATESPSGPQTSTNIVESSPEPVKVIRQVPESTEVITRRYLWSFSNKEWTAELKIPGALYSYYRSLPRAPTQNYSIYITHPSDDEYIHSLVNEITRIAQQEGFSYLKKAEFATAFVQSLPYTVDSVTMPYNEYPRYPIETLVDNGGDCEDTSILLASLLNSMGYGVVLVIFPETTNTAGHVGVGVLDTEGMSGAYFEVEGQRYFYIETTDTGWDVGVIPEDYKGVTAHIYSMVPTPIITHRWAATTTEKLWNSRITDYTVELEVTVENLGSRLADSVHILAGFDAGDGKIWNAVESQFFDLPVGQGVTTKLTLKAPLGKHTRLIIQIIDNDRAVDESYSEWFDT